MHCQMIKHIHLLTGICNISLHPHVSMCTVRILIQHKIDSSNNIYTIYYKSNLYIILILYFHHIFYNIKYQVFVKDNTCNLKQGCNSHETAIYTEFKFIICCIYCYRTHSNQIKPWLSKTQLSPNGAWDRSTDRYTNTLIQYL